MEVSSESNIDGGSGNEPNLPGESNNGNIRKFTEIIVLRVTIKILRVAIIDPFSLCRQNRRISVRHGSSAVYAKFHAGCRWTHGTWRYHYHNYKHTKSVHYRRRSTEYSRVGGQRYHERWSKYSSTVISLIN